MTEQPQTEETLFILKELEAKPNITQRDLSSRLSISLGKTNYLLRKLIVKGFIKAKSFTSNPGKLRKIHYLLTEKGLEEKLRLIKHFLQIKEVEYNQLKQEFESSLSDKSTSLRGGYSPTKQSNQEPAIIKEA